MDRHKSKQRAIMRRQAKALERIASALERGLAPEPLPVEEIELEGVIDWQDAILVLKTTCLQAIECGPECPMNSWCQTFNKEGSAPAKWEPIENDEEVTE